MVKVVRLYDFPLSLFSGGGGEKMNGLMIPLCLWMGLGRLVWSLCLLFISGCCFVVSRSEGVWSLGLGLS